MQLVDVLEIIRKELCIEELRHNFDHSASADYALEILLRNVVETKELVAFDPLPSNTLDEFGEDRIW